MKHPPRNVVIDWLNTIWETDLPSNAKLVACNLRRYMNSRHDMAWPSVGRVAGECGLSESTARRMLQLLVSEGWLVNNGRSAVETKVYQATFPGGVSQVQGVSPVPVGGVTATPELNKELNNTTTTTTRMGRPSIEEVRQYITEKGYTFDAGHFFNYYESQGWKVGKNPMVKWKATCVTWQQKEKQNDKNTKGHSGPGQYERGISGAEKTRRARAEQRERELRNTN